MMLSTPIPLMVLPISIRPIVIGYEASHGFGIPFMPAQRANGHAVFTGATGLGKSTILRFVASSLGQQGVPIVILDFHDDLELFGHRSVRIGDGPSGECSIRFLEPTPWAMRAFGLRGFLENAVSAIEEMGRRKLGEGQVNVLRSAIIEMWRRRGISEESCSDQVNYIGAKIVPSDLVNVLKEKREASESFREKQVLDGLISRIEGLASCSIFEHKEALKIDDILRNGARLHMQGIPAPMRGPVARLLVRMIFAEIVAMGPIQRSGFDGSALFRLYIVIDEAGSVIRRKADDCIVKTIAKESRKFGVGLLLAAQTLDDLSDEVVANADTHFALPTKSARDARKVEQKLNLSKGKLNAGTGPWSGYYQSGFPVYRAHFFRM